MVMSSWRGVQQLFSGVVSMPRALPVPIREEIVRRRQQGQEFVTITTGTSAWAKPITARKSGFDATNRHWVVSDSQGEVIARFLAEELSRERIMKLEVGHRKPSRQKPKGV